MGRSVMSALFATFFPLAPNVVLKLGDQREDAHDELARILALIAAGLRTVVAFAPAFAVGFECSDYPNLDRCPLYGGYANPTPHASPYQLAPGHIRHAQAYRTEMRADSKAWILASMSAFAD